MLKKSLLALSLGSLLFGAQAMAATYKIDKEGQHAFVNFKISHLGYSWLYGTFNDFDGSFSFDAAKPEASKVKVELQTASVDSNHAERDKHLRSGDFLNVAKHPTATFESTSVTKPVVIAAKFIGEGKDPWGGYRAGFQGSTKLALKDFNLQKDLGPASQEVELIISVEGVRQ